VEFVAFFSDFRLLTNLLKMKKSCLLLIGLLFLFSACDEGELLDNLPPETQLFLQEIDLSGPDRLNSVVTLHWSGEDQDGYVVAYEISQNETQWDRVTVQDSTFRFDLQAGSDTTDIDFWVRAIDNQQAVDPSPAYLRVPIRNTPPVVQLDTLKLIPDSVYSVFSVLWEVEDLDGLATLDSLFIRLNEGSWYSISPNTRFASLVPEQPDMAGPQNARLYLGTDATPQNVPLEGLEVDGDNRFYLRAKDIAGSFSKVDTSKSFFVRRQSSPLLLVDDHTTDDADDTYFEALSALSIGYDRLVMDDNIPPFWDPTFSLFLNLYNQVIWYSDGSVRNDLGGQMILDLAANQIQLFINQGGKIFISTRFPTSFNDPEVSLASPLFGLSPMDSLSSAPGQARIPVDSLIVPIGDFANDYPTLVCSNFVTGADPFYAKDPINDLYRAQLRASGAWTGPRTIAARSLFTNGEVNMIFFSVELHKLVQDKAAINALFDRILNQDFNW
jgi:hypothetical protein